MYTLDEVKYPIGKYERPEAYDSKLVDEWLSALEALPSWLDVCIENLDAAQLETPYREGGWNINQVIHHIADAHMNAYIRLKLALTEEMPTVKPWEENLWAVLPDTETVPVNVSITLIHALHRRWAASFRALTPEQWERCFYHPDSKRNFPMWELLALYAWHGRHHMEQVRGLRNRMNWW